MQQPSPRQDGRERALKEGSVSFLLPLAWFGSAERVYTRRMTVVIEGVVIRIAERRPSGTMAATELPENRRPDAQRDEPEGNDHKKTVEDHHNPRLVVRSIVTRLDLSDQPPLAGANLARSSADPRTDSGHDRSPPGW